MSTRFKDYGLLAPDSEVIAAIVCKGTVYKDFIYGLSIWCNM